jgi:hypothetical protein
MHSPVFPEIDIPSLRNVDLPLLRRVKLDQPYNPAIDGLSTAVRQAWQQASALDHLPNGADVAVAVGSRGLANLPVMVRETVSFLRDMGLRPFIVPAMGSHGGGTAEGQAGVLAKLGVTEDAVGAPVRASMEVVEIGRTDQNIPVFFDATASAAAAVVVIARVKSHTSFDRDIESGLTKMVAIGLGKQEGARMVHRLGPGGLRDDLPAAAEIAIAASPLVAGLAVVENARHETVHVELVPAGQFLDADRRLLKMAKSLLARLPFSNVDALLCEEIGKEISGAGMDYAVTGRTDLRGIANPDHILVNKIGILRLTEATAGNGVGTGLADFMPRDMANRLDLKAMYENALTSAIGEKCRIPIVLPSEKAVLQALAATSWAREPDAIRFCQIRNTLDLGEVLVSQALFEELGRPASSDPQAMRFDDTGRLLDLV